MLEQIRPYLGISLERFRQDEFARKDLVGRVHQKIQEALDQIKSTSEAAGNETWGGSLTRRVSSAWTAIRHPINTYYGPQTELLGLGWGTSDFIDSYSATYVANGPKYRTPGGYANNKEDSGDTMEAIHPCVGFRLLKKPDYKLGGMTEISRQRGKDGWEYVIGGAAPLPEYRMKESLDSYNSFERYDIQDEDVLKYIQGLDDGR